MIEGPAFYPLLSGISNLKVLAELAGISKDKCDELIALVGLGERKKSKFKTYSLGMKQRLGIAAALLPNPDLLILDEPTNGLDPNGILEIRNLIKTLALSGKTIFVSSHLLSELEAICDSFVMIKSGKIIYAGPKEGLISEVESESFTVEPEYKVDLASLVGIIGNAGYQFEIKDNLVEVFASSNFRAHINRLAFSDGITLRNLSAKTNSLEDTFFEMVLN
jgi:ABC-2 type transport system ATP-binding protein